LCLPVVCPPPPSPCHAEGICSFVATGTPECSHALKAELSECDDGDAVTVRDTCRLGQCQGEIIVPTPGPEVYLHHCHYHFTHTLVSLYEHITTS
jgi:hypothetical protein